jgi:hypothetical protein
MRRCRWASRQFSGHALMPGKERFGVSQKSWVRRIRSCGQHEMVYPRG